MQEEAYSLRVKEAWRSNCDTVPLPATAHIVEISVVCARTHGQRARCGAARRKVSDLQACCTSVCARATLVHLFPLFLVVLGCRLKEFDEAGRVSTSFFAVIYEAPFAPPPICHLSSEVAQVVLRSTSALHTG